MCVWSLGHTLVPWLGGGRGVQRKKGVLCVCVKLGDGEKGKEKVDLIYIRK